MFILPFPLFHCNNNKKSPNSHFLYFPHCVLSLSIFHTLSRSCPYLHSSHMRPASSLTLAAVALTAMGTRAAALREQLLDNPCGAHQCPQLMQVPCEGDTRGDRRCNHDPTHRVCAKIGDPDTSFFEFTGQRNWCQTKGTTAVRMVPRCAALQKSRRGASVSGRLRSGLMVRVATTRSRLIAMPQIFVQRIRDCSSPTATTPWTSSQPTSASSEVF